MKISDDCNLNKAKDVGYSITLSQSINTSKISSDIFLLVILMEYVIYIMCIFNFCELIKYYLLNFLKIFCLLN